MDIIKNAQMLQKAIYDKELTPDAKLVYSFLWNEGNFHGFNSCNLCNEYIANTLNLERKTIRPALTLLKKKGYINIFFIRCLEFYDIGSIRTIEYINIDFERELKPIQVY